MTGYSWEPDADGNWSTAADWTPSGPPAAYQDVLISTAHFHTITHSSNHDAIGNFTLGADDLAITGGSELDVHGNFSSTGTVSISGAGSTFVLDAGGTSGALGLSVATGGVLDFAGGAFTLTSTGTIAGAGLVEVTGGTLELGSSNVTMTNLSQTAGVIDGTGILTVMGAATSSNSYDSETGSGTTVLKGTTTDSGNLTLDGGRVLENKGTFNWTGNTVSMGYNPYGTSIGNAKIENYAGATFDIQSDQNVYSYAGTNAFVSAGLLEKTTTFGTTHIQATFTNTGTVLV